MEKFEDSIDGIGSKAVMNRKDLLEINGKKYSLKLIIQSEQVLMVSSGCSHGLFKEA